ncbi:hypothetical protein B0H12DRAFT_1123576 [Mycena haematopus]|nr:hypothetical protein B0H12DRAFT_1123576 [Mycena haematopus]
MPRHRLWLEDNLQRLKTATGGSAPSFLCPVSSLLKSISTQRPFKMLQSRIYLKVEHIVASRWSPARFSLFSSVLESRPPLNLLLSPGTCAAFCSSSILLVESTVKIRQVSMSFVIKSSRRFFQDASSFLNGSLMDAQAREFTLQQVHGIKNYEIAGDSVAGGR